MLGSLSSALTATLAPTPSPNLMIKQIDQEIARLQQLRAGLQAQIDDKYHVETSEKRVAATVDKFIKSFGRDHLEILRTIAAGKAVKASKARQDIVFRACAGGNTATKLKLSAIGKRALLVLEQKYAAEDKERREGLFGLYNA